MSTDRIGGPPPPSEPSKGGSPDSKKFREELQKVQKVKEVDPDEQSRKRNQRFAAQMGDEDKPEDLNPRKASPFEASFYVDKPKSLQFNRPPSRSAIENSGNSAVPSPAYSPPPNVEPTSKVEADSGVSSKSLPTSNSFWEDVDLPDEPLPPAQNFQETTQSQERSGNDSGRREARPETKRGKERRELAAQQFEKKPAEKNTMY